VTGGIREDPEGSGRISMQRRPSYRPRVLIADDHVPAVDHIQRTLCAEFEVVATVRDGRGLSAAALKLEPDFVLIDMALAIADGFDAVKEIAQNLPHTRIIFHAAEEGCGACSARTAAESQSAACSLVAGDPSGCPYSEAIELARKAPAVPACKEPADSAPCDQELTEREYEVLALLAAGQPMKRVAHRLGITYRTVTFHKYRMMEKLGITTNAGLMNYALRRNITSAVPPGPPSMSQKTAPPPNIGRAPTSIPGAMP
jgi:DNA-binding NarL/FixJ family response regulator